MFVLNKMDSISKNTPQASKKTTQRGQNTRGVYFCQKWHIKGKAGLGQNLRCVWCRQLSQLLEHNSWLRSLTTPYKSQLPQMSSFELLSGWVTSSLLAWVSGLPKGLGERRFQIFPLFPQKRLILRLLLFYFSFYENQTLWMIHDDNIG